jgi:hypothetical protein
MADESATQPHLRVLTVPDSPSAFGSSSNQPAAASHVLSTGTCVIAPPSPLPALRSKAHARVVYDDFVSRHRLDTLLDDLMEAVLTTQPAEPISFMVARLKQQQSPLSEQPRAPGSSSGHQSSHLEYVQGHRIDALLADVMKSTLVAQPAETIPFIVSELEKELADRPGRRLAESKQLARQLIDVATTIEPAMTAKLQALAAANGGELRMLEQKFKSEDSLAAKLSKRSVRIARKRAIPLHKADKIVADAQLRAKFIDAKLVMMDVLRCMLHGAVARTRSLARRC